MNDPTQSSDPNVPIDLTLGELRRLRVRAAWAKGDMDREAQGLRYDITRINERLTALEGDALATGLLLERIDRTIAEAEKLPRGRRVVLNAPWAYPKYNPHRRLAVMERSFL